MNKPLSDMTLEELWQLFPIFLTPHDPEWTAWYREEAGRLRTAWTGPIPWRIHHIGSTAVPGIWAKPIIDMLVEIPAASSLQELKAFFVSQGYLCHAETARRISLNKGYTEDGFAPRVFHLHLGQAGDHDELYFRDYLSDHPFVAKEYETLKRTLWKRFEFDRDGYTEAKTAFVTVHTKAARALYQDRYE